MATATAHGDEVRVEGGDMPLLGQDVRVRQRVASARRAGHGAARGQRQAGSPAGQRQPGSPHGKPRRRSTHGAHRVLVERSGRTSTGEFVAEIQGAQLVAQHIAGGRHGETLEHRLINMEGALREQQGMLAESHHRILALLKENESLRVENQKLRSNHSEPPEVLHLRAAVDGLHRRNEDLERAMLSARRSAGTVAVATSSDKAAAVEYLVDADEGTAKVAMAMSRGRAAALKLADETDSPGHGSLPHGAATERGVVAAQTIIEKHAPHLAATPPQQLRLSDSTKASSTQLDGSSESAVFQARGAGNALGGKEAREAIAAALAAGERNANAVFDGDLEETAQIESLDEAERKQAVAAAAEMRVQLAKEEAQATVELYQAAAAAATAASAAEVERQKEASLNQQYERMLERKQVTTEEPQREGGSSDLQPTTDDLQRMGKSKVVAWDSNELQPEPELQSEPQLEPGSHVSGSHKPSPPQSHSNVQQNPNRRRLRQQHRGSFKPVEHDEAWSVSTAAVERPGSARRPSTVSGGKSDSGRVRPGGVAAQSVYGSPRSAGGVAVAKKEAIAEYQVGETPETHVSAAIEVAARASELHSRVQREIWRKEREVDLSGLRAAEQEHKEAEQRIREEEIGDEGHSNETSQAERSFGERLLSAETGWRRPVSAAAASHGERVNTGARTSGAIDDGPKERPERKASLSEVDPAATEGGALLRLLRETPPPSVVSGYRKSVADPGPCTDADSSVASLTNATQPSGSRPGPPRRTQKTQTARTRRQHNAAGRNGLQRDGGRGGAKKQGGGPTAAPTGESHPWSARTLDRPRHRPRTAPAPNAARRSGNGAAGSRKGQRKPSAGDNVVGLMLLGPQRVRIADASASMLESIERTATILERAGRGVQANHAEPEISWQHHTVGDAAIEEEGQLGEVYRLV